MPSSSALCLCAAALSGLAEAAVSTDLKTLSTRFNPTDLDQHSTGLQKPQAKNLVSFWYAVNAYGGEDIQAVLDILSANNGTVTNMMVYCGHTIAAGGQIVLDEANAALCLDNGLFKNLTDLGVAPEIIINSGTNNIKDYRVLWANDTSVDYIVSEAKRFGAKGVNFDLEPQVGITTRNDAEPYAAYLAKVRTGLAAQEQRLTACVAAWSPMLSQYATLAASVDRLHDMETYTANSYNGWLTGDMYGGQYSEFVTRTPLAQAAPAIGGWNQTCGKELCWTSTPESVAPRLNKMLEDGIQEAAVFRLLQVAGSEMPQSFWWPALRNYSQGIPCS